MNLKERVYAGLILCGLLAFGLLLPHTAPHMTSGDSGELALAGATLGVAHSPGYPVFSMVNHLGCAIVGLGNPAYRQNLLSLFFMIFGLILLGYCIFRFTRRWGAAFLPFLFLLSQHFRNQGMVTEVFPLAFFYAVLLVTVMVRLGRENRGRNLLMFMFGFGIAIHQTLALIYPAILFYCFYDSKINWKAILKNIPIYILLFALGWSVNIFIAIRSSANPILDWEDPETWDRFWGIVFRERYGFTQLAQGGQTSFSLHAQLASWRFFKEKLIENFGWIGVGMLLVGTLSSLMQKTYRRLMTTSWIWMIFSGPVFFLLARVDLISNASVILDRFVSLSLIGAFLIMALGLISLWNSRITLYRVAMAGLLLVFLFEGGIRNPPKLYAGSIPVWGESASSMRWELTLREIVMNTLHHLPKNAILFSDRADELEFGLAYVLGVEEKRSDIQFVDANAGVSKSIYGDDYYQIWGPRRLRRREKIENELIQKSDIPVYYATVDPNMVNIYRTPWGYLYRAWRFDQISNTNQPQWDKLLAWRFMPNEKRIQLILGSVWRIMGVGLFDANQVPASRTAYGLLQRVGGEHPDVQLGFRYQVRGQTRSARKYYRRALDKGVRSTVLFSNMGYLDVQRGLFDEAIVLFERGLADAPNSVGLLYNLSTVHWRKKDWAKVVPLLERVVELDPQHEEASAILPKAKGMFHFLEKQREAELRDEFKYK